MEKGTAERSAFATVKSVQNDVKLTDEQITDVLETNLEKHALTEKQKERWHKKYLCLVGFEKVEAITPPLAFDHQSNMDDWLMVEKIEDVVVGTSLPYSYKKSRF